MEILKEIEREKHLGNTHHNDHIKAPVIIDKFIIHLFGICCILL